MGRFTTGNKRSIMNNILNYNEFLLNEEFSFSETKEIIKNIGKEFNLNVIFLTTFGTGIAAFFPIAKHIIDKQNLNINISKESIILCVIAAFAVAFKEMETDKLKNYIKENKLSNVFNYFVKSLKSFKNIYEYLITFKAVEFLSDTFTYTMLLAPFMMTISNIINEKIMTLEDLIGCGLSIGVGITSLTLKNVIKYIWSKIKK